jgi:ferredoxin
MEKKNFTRPFRVPDAAAPYIDAIVSPFEQQVIADLACEAESAFTADDVARALSRQPGADGATDADDFIAGAYKRGIISIVEGPEPRYAIADFYGRLDIFAITERDAWRALPQDARQAIEAWYFDAFYDRLDWTADGGKPTDENILTLSETLQFIDDNDAKGKQVYLTDCDCRSLLGECDKPTLVCLSYSGGANSYPDRGLSRPISAREAKAVVTAADRAGLVHTANPWGVCNCCGDCCYLFRARARRGSGAAWPESHYIITIDNDKCMGCGICLGRCMFGVFDESDLACVTGASADPTRCVGCGVCVSTCPTGALTLTPRTAAAPTPTDQTPAATRAAARERA